MRRPMRLLVAVVVAEDRKYFFYYMSVKRDRER